MSNPNAPFGLRPVRHIDGSPWNGQTIRCYCSASYATALFIGDPVMFGGTTLSKKDATVKHMTIETNAGTTGLMINGVITSFEPNPDNLTQQYRPASQERWANVVVATPNVVFQVRDDGSGTPAPVFTYQNAELAAGSGGSTKTGLSSFVLDASTPAATQAHPLLILGLADIPDNELDDYAIWEVLINTCYNATGLYLGVTAT